MEGASVSLLPGLFFELGSRVELWIRKPQARMNYEAARTERGNVRSNSVFLLAIVRVYLYCFLADHLPPHFRSPCVHSLLDLSSAARHTLYIVIQARQRLTSRAHCICTFASYSSSRARIHVADRPMNETFQICDLCPRFIATSF